GLVLSACGREVLNRRSDEACGCGVAIGLGHVIRGGAEAAFEIHRDRKIGRVNDSARVREHLVAGDPAVARAVCAGSRVAGGGDRRKAKARQNARRSRIPGVGDDERAGPLMEWAERIGFVELSDGHNELIRSVVQGLLLRRTLRRRGGSFGSNSILAAFCSVSNVSISCFSMRLCGPTEAPL